jgi:hypothetical protein
MGPTRPLANSRLTVKGIDMTGESTKEQHAAKSFAELLAELPAQSDTVTLVGVVTRSAKEGHFRLTPQGGGQHVELPVAAVRGHSVLHREPGHLLVQVEAERAGIEPLLEEINEFSLSGGVRTYLTSPYSWARDPIHLQKVQFDPMPHEMQFAGGAVPGGPAGFAAQGGGLAPFVLATPHHAPPGPLAMQTAGLQRQMGVFTNKAPAADLVQKTLVHDQGMQKHAPFDTLKESIADTLKEATTDAQKDFISDPTLKEVVTDTYKEAVTDTFKEAVKDGIYDTLKEVVADATLVEPGGTLAEGTGTLAEGGPQGPGGGINQFGFNQF